VPGSKTIDSDEASPVALASGLSNFGGNPNTVLIELKWTMAANQRREESEKNEKFKKKKKFLIKVSNIDSF